MNKGVEHTRLSLRSPDRRLLAGFFALAALGVLVAGAVVGLAVEAARDSAGLADTFDVYLVRIAGFTLWQAALSTLISVLPGLLVARALSRHPDFPGRRLLLRLFAVPLGLPAIVAALGLLALYGRAGFFAEIINPLIGARWPGIYGLSGILIAHAFFNVPLATRLFLETLDMVGSDQWRLAAQLGMGARPAFRFIEWPVLRAALPGVAGLIFMLCVTSFTLVLTLGGGPSATTLEVAIYQALRFDFDPARAVALTLTQIVLTVLALVVLSRAGSFYQLETASSVAARRPITTTSTETGLNAIVIVVATLFVVSPLAAIVASGLRSDLARLSVEPAVLRATGTSLGLATLSAILAVTCAASLASARFAAAGNRGPAPARLARMIEASAGLVLVLPPIVLGAGWFVLLRNAVHPSSAAPVLIVAVNAAMAVPFAMRAIGPAHDAAAARYDRLAASLGIRGLDRLRLIDWPVLRRPLAVAFAFSAALSLGDLGVVALFGSDSVQTLPYLLLARMGSYRTADAAGLALLLGVLCLALMALADRLGEPSR